MASDQPLVSVITVCYNAEAYIERTVKSILAQQKHYPNIEYVIVDGVSKDKTLEILESYALQFHNYNFKSEPDKSLYDAMNKGIQRATGDYIVFINAGDVLAQEDSLALAMKESKDADLVYAKAVFVDEEGNRRAWHKTVPTSDQLSARSFINGMVICHQCMIVKRSCTPLFALEPWKIACDLDWSIRVLRQVKTKHFYDAIFCLFLDGGVSDKRRMQAVRERFDICKHHFGIFPTLIEQFKILLKVIKRRGKVK